MSFWEIIILSIIQGVAEFLPISSSGHLVIANQLFGLNNPETNLLLIILLHLASLIAILISFYEEIIDIITNNFRVLFLIIVGTIPAGLIGFFLSDYIGQLFTKPFVVGIGLMLTGLYMMLSELHWKSAPTSLERAGIKQALWVGIAQAVAIIPGISRSGLTLATGLFNGWEKQSAIKFSFLLAIPVMLGASLLKIKDFSKLSVSFQPIPILVGFIICLGVSLLSISFLVKMVRRGHLSYFAWYCLIVGLFVVIFI
ncbi:MAG: undecaprenyl-diphosphate phosphatase [Planctomycetota bacterium]